MQRLAIFDKVFGDNNYYGVNCLFSKEFKSQLWPTFTF